MAYILPAFRLAYFSVPKVACTSIKHMLYEAEHGEPYAVDPAKGGKKKFIHGHYPSTAFETVAQAPIADFTRIAVVRDPVRRVLSAYSNRVLHHRELSEAKAGDVLAEAGLPVNPDIHTFLERLPEYCAAVKKIRHHTLPQVHFLGTDPGYLTRVYRFSELEEMAADIRRITGTEVQMPWKQTGGKKIDIAELTKAEIDRLRDTYAADYAAFGAYFD